MVPNQVQMIGWRRKSSNAYYYWINPTSTTFRGMARKYSIAKGSGQGNWIPVYRTIRPDRAPEAPYNG
jgi:hypothetical protein